MGSDMGIHVFVMRSWYFLAIAFVGTLHISIPLAIATYYATRDAEPLTMLMFTPVFFMTIAFLNVNAMRAVIRSYGLTGEPEFTNMVKSVMKHVTLDTMLPLNLAFLIAALVSFAIYYGMGPDVLVLGFFDPRQVEELAAGFALIESMVNLKVGVLANIFTVMPYVYPVILCIFGVSIAAGAANGSINPPGHLPIHAPGAKFWYIVSTILVNWTMVGVLATGAGFGAVWGIVNEIDILPSIGFGIMGLVLLLGYFNAYVVFALAYCAHEEEARAERQLISELRRYGMRDEGLDVRALRASRMKGVPGPAE
jgi:hypothetical protein